MTLLLACSMLGHGAVDNIGADGAVTANSMNAAAKPGSLVRITVAAAPKPGRTEVLIGAATAKITHTQINNGQQELTFRIPLKAEEGCFVPVHVRRNGTLLPDSVPIAIARQGVCRQPGYQPSDAWLTKKTGLAVRAHSTEWSLETGGALSTVDMVAAFFDGAATTLQPGALLRFPPPGLCASGQRSYVRGTPTIDILLPLLFEEVNGKELDAGELLSVDDGRYQIRIPRVVGHGGLFWKTVSSSQQEFQQLKTGGDLYLRVPGGRDVSPFVAPISVPPAWDWRNRPASPLLDVRKDTPLSWSAAAPGLVLLAAIAVDPANARFSYCLCVAPTDAQRFDLPGRVLGSFVTSAGDGKETAGSLYLIHIPEAVSQFSSSLLETTAGISLRMLSAKVVYRR